MQLQIQRPAIWLPAAPSRGRAIQVAITIVECAVIASVAWHVARLGWTVATPVTPLGDWQLPPRQALASDRSSIGSFDPFFRSAVNEGGPISSLSLVLSGTRVDNVSGRGSAIIASKDGVQTSYAVGDSIEPGVTLTAVGFDSATISRAGVSEKLFIDQSAGGTPTTPDDVAADAAPGPALAADVTITPRLQGGSLTGYVLTPRASGAAFAAAGLQPGDVLVSVNGATATSLNDVAGLTRQLDAGDIDIGIERGGRLVTLRIGRK